MVQVAGKKLYESTMKELQQVDFPDVINLNVGGQYYVTKRSTLTKDGDSMLAVMFSGRHHIDKDSEGRYFIDRDGAYFGYILNFLRDNLELPPLAVSLQVYKEAQFYQVRSLIEKLERNAQIFALKLDEARKSRLGNSFAKWKDTVVSTAQMKSLNKLSSKSSVNLISRAEHKSIINSSECQYEVEHTIVVNSENRKNSTPQNVCFESLKKRLTSPDVVIDIPQGDMGLFVEILQEELQHEGYSCKVWLDELRCNNEKTIMGYCVEKCEFHVNEYFVEFEWALPKTENRD